MTFSCGQVVWEPDRRPVRPGRCAPTAVGRPMFVTLLPPVVLPALKAVCVQRPEAMAKGGRRSTSWACGVSGNPAGRPRSLATIEGRKVIADVKAAARALTPEAIATLLTVMTDAKAPPAARVGAATGILDRGWGKPTQSVEPQVSVLDRMTDDELCALLAALDGCHAGNDGGGSCSPRTDN